jgi:hypothetical protein
MAEWITISHPLPDKPEVHAIASTLDIDPDAVVGKLIRIWIWADQQTIDGNARSVTKALLDRITMCRGFAAAMQNAGWLTENDVGVQLPNFERHNGETSKIRQLAGRRVRKHRENKGAAQSCNARSVTKALPEHATSNTTGNADSVTKALPDKRRVEENRADQKTVEKTTSKTTTNARASYSDDFERFWNLWKGTARRINKPAAFKAYCRALSHLDNQAVTRSDLDENRIHGHLCDRASAYVDSETGRSDFCKSPAVWLNQECYDEADEDWKRGNGKPDKPDVLDGLRTWGDKYNLFDGAEDGQKAISQGDGGIVDSDRQVPF